MLASPDAARDAAHHHGPIKKSRSARWRAIVLVLVHVVVGVHVALWLALGLTLSPVEPSESVQTITQGVVNAGFVFFVLAIGSTVLFGRYFCGWGCHIVALQDLCSHLMTRLGVRPKPFRSRLLVFAPMALGFYMFFWPIVHRHVVTPLFADEAGELPAWLGESGDTPGLSTEFLVDDFWATFPTWYVAIPFIGVCTFGAVYFLGSKGFCTYGCPYGGLFGPADLVSVGRIKVNDDCEGCGHCTAVCTSNVRVHEEVRDFGQVMDPGCMKCMDCVSVCPKHALHFGFGTPAILKKPTPHPRLLHSFSASQQSPQAQPAGARSSPPITPEQLREKARASRRARYDLNWGEELAVAVLFVAFLVAFRGMLNMVPLLMAVAMAGIAAFCCWRSWSMLVGPRRVASARVQSVKLKHKGRMTWAGRAFVVVTLVLVGMAGWSGTTRYHLWRGGLDYAQMSVPLPSVLRPEFVPSAREYAAAKDGIAHYTRADTFLPLDPDYPSPRGAGWKLAPDHEINLAYLYCVVGDFGSAERRLRSVIEHGHPTDSLVFQLGEIIRRRGRERVLIAQAKGEPAEKLQAMVDEVEAEVTAAYRWALPLHDNLSQVRTQVTLADRRTQEIADAPSVPESAMGLTTSGEPAGDPSDAQERLGLIEQRLALAADDERATLVDAMGGHVDHALAGRHVNPETKLRAAGLLMSTGRSDHKAKAQSLIDDALAEAGQRVNGRPGGVYIQAAGLLASLNEPKKAIAVLDEGIAKDAESRRAASTLSSAGELLLRLSAPAQRSPQEGGGGGDAELRTRALDVLAQAAAELEHQPWDLAQLGGGMVRAGAALRDERVTGQGLAALASAAAQSSHPVLLYDHAAALLMAGRREEAVAAAQRAVAAAEAAASTSGAPMNAVFLLNMAELAARAGRMDVAAPWGQRGEELLKSAR